MQRVQVKKTLNDYMETTSKRLKIIDAYMLYIFLTGITQLIYCLLLDRTSPFKTFLSGFISTVTCLALAFCLRMKVADENEPVKVNDENKGRKENEENEAKGLSDKQKDMKENDEDQDTKINDGEENTKENGEEKTIETSDENKEIKKTDEDDAIKSKIEEEIAKEKDDDEVMETSDKNTSMKDTSKSEATKTEDESRPLKLFDKYKTKFSHISTERAFVEFIIAHAVFHLIIMNFLS